MNVPTGLETRLQLRIGNILEIGRLSSPFQAHAQHRIFAIDFHQRPRCPDIARGDLGDACVPEVPIIAQTIDGGRQGVVCRELFEHVGVCQHLASDPTQASKISYLQIALDLGVGFVNVGVVIPTAPFTFDA